MVLVAFGGGGLTVGFRDKASPKDRTVDGDVHYGTFWEVGDGRKDRVEVGFRIHWK